MPPIPTAALNDDQLQPVLEFREVTKSFGPSKVVDRVSLALQAGEIHALVGENGAGKSTLIRVLAGDYTPESGAILLNGERAHFSHPGQAIAAGVGFVHQTPMFVPNLSVTENLFLGVPYQQRNAALINWTATHRAAREDLAKVGLAIDPRQSIEELRPHERQLVAVARALRRKPRILVLDEVTASLSEPEVRILHDVIRRSRANGMAVIYVSHRLEEIFRVADRVTVLRDGRNVGTRAVAGLTHKAIAEMIVGSSVDHLFGRRSSDSSINTSRPMLVVRGLEDERLKNVSLQLFSGEILGLAGLGGSGRSRLMRLLFGARIPLKGSIEIEGDERKFRAPADALRAGVALLTEDRQDDGYVQTMPIWQNVTLPWLDRYRQFGLLQSRRERSVAAQATRRFQVRMPGITAQMSQLSGGNQQKILLGRWVTGNPRVLLLDEPTHGVDIRSKGEIHDIIRTLAAQGIGVIVASSELEEIEALCHRVLLLRQGCIIDEYRGTEITKERVLHALLAEREGD